MKSLRNENCASASLFSCIYHSDDKTAVRVCGFVQIQAQNGLVLALDDVKPSQTTDQDMVQTAEPSLKPLCVQTVQCCPSVAVCPFIVKY